jgi:hypothetical protein
VGQVTADEAYGILTPDNRRHVTKKLENDAAIYGVFEKEQSHQRK